MYKYAKIDTVDLTECTNSDMEITFQKPPRASRKGLLSSAV